MKTKYYEAMVDVHINYLLFLNTCYVLSDVGFLELAPILNEIRYEVYEKIKSVENLDNNDINEVIKEKIQESLMKRKLISVCNYVDAFICESDINNIGLAVFLRRVSDSIDITTGNKIADQFINKLHFLVPTSDLSIDTKANSVIEYFLSDLRIRYDRRSDIKVYILEALSYFNIICNYLCVDNNLSNPNIEIDDILNSLTRLSIRLNSFKSKLVLEKSN